jgi:hypothetical protein
MTVTPRVIDPATRKNAGLWRQVLPQVADWLRINHLASCAMAAEKFGINTVTLAQQLEVEYPGEFDFTERRRLRGIANKPVVKNPRKKQPPPSAADLATQMADVLKAFDEVVNKLALIETAILKLSEAEKRQ